MAARTVNHARSSSTPSLPHPLANKAAEKLHNIITCIQGAEASFVTICSLLKDLANLFETLHILLCLPSLQRLLPQPLHKRWLEAQLDFSLQLLDIEAPIIDCLKLSKFFVIDMQTALRRRGHSDYVSSRKKAQKEVLICLKSLKKIEERFAVTSLVVEEGDLVIIDRLMRRARDTTVVALRSLLSLLEIPERRKEWGRWIFLVPKVMQWRRGGRAEGNGMMVGLEPFLSAAFECISGKIDGSGSLKREAHEEVKQVESWIEGLEIGLQRLFRQMIQNRVVLLNMLSF